MARRLVTLEQKAEAVAVYQSEQFNAMEAERKTGFHNSAIGRWHKALAVNEELARLTEEKRIALGAKFATLTDRILDRAHADLDQLQITDRNFVSLLGVSAEKALLYAGQPTEIVETRVKISVQEAESKLQRLLPYFPDRASALEALRAADDEAAAALEAEVTS